jgi:serine/threonine protein kinase
MMKPRKELREWPRETLPPSEIGIIYPQYHEKSNRLGAKIGEDTLLVPIRNRGEGGLLFLSPLRFDHGIKLDMRIRVPHEKAWMAFKGVVVRAEEDPKQQGYYQVGVELETEPPPKVIPEPGAAVEKKRMYPSDVDFFMEIPLFDAISDEAKCPLLNCMTPTHFRKGEKFIKHGKEGDSLYIVQEGSCVVHVPKQQKEHSIRRLRAGDIVGEIALLTGEPRTAHVDAETDMKLWCISRSQFDGLCEQRSDLTNFLTELVCHRLSSEIYTAEKNIAKYTVDQIVGSGGWSIVYKGVHAALNMPVAIKMLRHDMAMDPDFRSKFRYEAKIIARLNHKNIVKVYDIEELYKTIFIITEYLKGMPLDSLLDEMPRLPLSRVQDIVIQICEGLEYAHARGIVHQDIKPANIFIQSDNQVKILDFGLACTPGKYENGAMDGTVFYMSPEQIDGERIDERTDIYSLGLTAFEMVTGQRPYPEDDIGKVMELHLNEDVPDPRKLVPDLPEGVSNFIMRATQREPSARYKSISHALKDLEALAEMTLQKNVKALKESLKESRGESETTQVELDRRVFHLKTLYDLSKDMFGLVDSEIIVKNFLLMTMGNFGVVQGFILVVDTSTGEPTHFVSMGFHDRDPDLLQIGAKRLLLEGDFSGSAENAAVVESADFLPLEILCTLYFAVGPDWSGLVGLGSKLTGDPYSEDDKELLITFANNLIVALRNTKTALI